jgi:hypothetical protein
MKINRNITAEISSSVRVSCVQQGSANTKEPVSKLRKMAISRSLPPVSRRKSALNPPAALQELYDSDHSLTAAVYWKQIVRQLGYVGNNSDIV